jgi:hypothetical protein
MAWTADSKAVVFYSNRNGPFHVFKQDIHSSQPVLLVRGPDDLYVPRMTPDQRTILYIVRPRADETTDEARLMRIPWREGFRNRCSRLRVFGMWSVRVLRRISASTPPLTMVRKSFTGLILRTETSLSFLLDVSSETISTGSLLRMECTPPGPPRRMLPARSTFAY